MNRTIYAAFLLTAMAALGDQVVMKNGDKVTGTVVKKDDKTLTIKSVHFGVVTLPWAEIAQLNADTALTVVLPGGRTVKGPVKTAGDKIEVGGSREPVSAADIVAIRDEAEQKAYERLLAPGWGQLWAGSGGLGFAGTSGNAQTQTFTAALNGARVTNTDKTFLYFNAIKASALVAGTKAGTAQAIRGGWGYNRNLKPRLFANFFNDYEFDKFQNLDLRFVLGAGLGFKAIRTERSVLDILGGLAYNRETFDPARPAVKFTRSGADAYWGDDFTFKLSNTTVLNQNFRMFNSLNDSNRWRMNFDLSATTKISKSLTWNIGISDRFLNLPVAGRKKNDFLYTTGIGITFAQ